MGETTVLIEDVKRKKTGWFDIQTDGEKYGTQDKDLATEARDLIDKGPVRIVFGTSESDWGTNYYLNKILGPVSGNGASAGPVSVKDMMIMRQTAAKVAAFLAPHLPEEDRTPQGLVQLAEFWLDYFINGPGEVAQLEDPDDDIPW